jgi:hypothetical protein
MFDSQMDRPQRPTRWDDFREWLFELTDAERLYVRRWVARYVNRWGQIPMLPSFRHSVATRRRDPPEPPSGSGRAP